MKKSTAPTDRWQYTGNDELYPTEVRFVNGLRVRIAYSEDGQLYIRVEEAAAE